MCFHLKVTLSTVNSKPSISRAPASSSPSASSSTPLNKATVDSHRATVRATHNLYCVYSHAQSKLTNILNGNSVLQVLARVHLPSILSISRDKANSMAHTAPPREALEHRHRGPMPMSRYIKLNHSFSNVSDCLKYEKCENVWIAFLSR